MRPTPKMEDDIEIGEPFLFTTDEADIDRRLDVIVTEASKRLDVALSRTRVKALVEDGCLTLDGDVVRDGNRKLKAGQVVSLAIPAAIDPEPRGENLPLVVVYEDDHLIVVDKPAGMVVHPAPGHPTGTLVNALIGHCGDSLSGIGGVKRPGIVHRLDKDTSGLLAVAKTDAAHRGFSKLFADHGRTLSLKRSYLAFVWGKPDRLFGSIDAPLGRHPTDRQRMAVVSEAKGREAITHWRLEEGFGRLEEGFGRLEEGFGRLEEGFGRQEEGFGRLEEGFGRLEEGFGRLEEGFGRQEEGFGRQEDGFGRLEQGFGRLEDSVGRNAKTPVASLITCVLETGRTHQIRVHMAHCGHPVLGDPIYSKGFLSKTTLLSAAAQARLASLGRQALHAAILGFAHPITGEILEFKSALPPDLTRLHEALRG